MGAAIRVKVPGLPGQFFRRKGVWCYTGDTYLKTDVPVDEFSEDLARWIDLYDDGPDNAPIMGTADRGTYYDETDMTISLWGTRLATADEQVQVKAALEEEKRQAKDRHDSVRNRDLALLADLKARYPDA